MRDRVGRIHQTAQVVEGDAETLGLWQAVSIGVGGMVGGGIFAVLGLSVELSGGAAPIAFALAGGVAAFTARSYSKLSIRYPDRGGTITYLNEAFGGGVLSGGLNVLLWLSYIVMLSLYAEAFGNYVTTFLPDDAPQWTANAALTAAIVSLTALNALSAAAVGRAEEWIVALKISILALFVIAGLTSVDPGRLGPDTWESPLAVVGGGMLIFVAYEGFELIANAAEDVARPSVTLPRAFAITVSAVIVLYVLVATVTVGILSPEQIAASSDFALAEAARPTFGAVGFTIIAVAALLSTASAINATLYGSTRLTFGIARSGELPPGFARRLRGGLAEGLLITSGLTLLIANTLDISRISTTGSAGFLLIFAAVNVAQVRLRATGTSPWPGIIAAAACILALAALVTVAGGDDPVAMAIAGGLVLAAFVIEFTYRAATGRTITHRFGTDRHLSDHGVIDT